jgi:hypothetical protein
VCLLSRTNRKLAGEEVKGVGVMKEEEVKPEKIETSHILGGYRSCRSYSDVKYTIVNRSRQNLLPEGQRFGHEKNPWHGPVCMRERGALAWDTMLMFFVYYNGENESQREEMRWCRCYEGQRDES